MQQAYSAFSKQGMSTQGVVLPLRAHSLFENRPMTNCKKIHAYQLQHIHLARSFPLPKIDQSSFFTEEIKSGWNIRQKNIDLDLDICSVYIADLAGPARRQHTPAGESGLCDTNDCTPNV